MFLQSAYQCYPRLKADNVQIVWLIEYSSPLKPFDPIYYTRPGFVAGVIPSQDDLCS